MATRSNYDILDGILSESEREEAAALGLNPMHNERVSGGVIMRADGVGREYTAAELKRAGELNRTVHSATCKPEYRKKIYG